MASGPPLRVSARPLGGRELRMLAGFVLGAGFGVCALSIGVLRTLVIAGCGLMGTLLAVRGDQLWRRIRRR